MIPELCYFCSLNLKVTIGTIAQLVEQWTENPCVPGSIPGGTTDKAGFLPALLFYYSFLV
jgi:hypothetical protein